MDNRLKDESVFCGFCCLGRDNVALQNQLQLYKKGSFCFAKAMVMKMETKNEKTEYLREIMEEFQADGWTEEQNKITELLSEDEKIDNSEAYAVLDKISGRENKIIEKNYFVKQ